MKSKIFVVMFACFFGLYAASVCYADSYPLKSVCPNGGAFQQGDYWNAAGQYWVNGVTGLAQCNCTDYVAEKLRDFGINFTNQYLGTHWGNGKDWNDAAGAVEGQNISVDQYPLPGDVAYWEGLSIYGHVAWVEKVHYDSNGNVTGIDVTEYNYTNACQFGERSGGNRLDVGDSDYPDGFIHVLAYNEGVTSLYYLDCSEMGNLCDSQTSQEWNWITNRVWNNYRCTNCNSNYSTAYVNAIAEAMGGMGGGPGYETLATDSAIPNLPDFIVRKTWIETPWGVEAYKYGLGESFKLNAQSKNIGSGSCSGDITGHVYLKLLFVLAYVSLK